MKDPTADPSVAGLWSDYARSVLPADAPRVQVIETQRAFYAGARGLLGLIMSTLDPGSEPTDADLTWMNRIAQELRTFAIQTAAGSN